MITIFNQVQGLVCRRELIQTEPQWGSSQPTVGWKKHCKLLWQPIGVQILEQQQFTMSDEIYDFIDLTIKIQTERDL